MDKKRMSEIYLRLHQLLDINSNVLTDGVPQSYDFSVTDSDIIMSEEMGRVLDEIKPGQRDESLGDLVRIQLSADELLLFINQKCDEKFRSLSQHEQYKECIKYILDYDINPYTEDEQKAILFNMIGSAQTLRGINQRNLSGYEIEEFELQKMRLSQQTRDQLRELVIEEIIKITPLVMKDAPSLVDESDHSIQVDPNQQFSVGAGACAAYAASEELRHFPETVGMMTAAVPEIKKESKHQNRFIDLLLAISVSSMICSFMFGGAMGIGFLAMGAFFKENGGIEWLRRAYADLVQAFSVDLKFSSNINNINAENREMVQADQSMENDVMEEEEENQDEENENQENNDQENNEYIYI